jgi:hypothetical protein
MGSSQLGAQLTADEIDKIVGFLASLTGEQPKVVYPALPPSAATTASCLEPPWPRCAQASHHYGLRLL